MIHSRHCYLNAKTFFVMHDIRVYYSLLQQKLTQFDFLSGMTFGSFSTDYYRL